MISGMRIDASGRQAAAEISGLDDNVSDMPHLSWHQDEAANAGRKRIEEVHELATQLAAIE